MEDLPYRAEFDVILALDVIEHLDDDLAALLSISAALTPRGAVILAVPQHPFLWSRIDEIGHHRRRYRRSDLLQKAEASGLHVTHTLSYAYLLFPLLLLNRCLGKLPGRRVNEMEELEIHPLLNRVLGVVMRAENLLSRVGFRARFGGSLIVVAHKVV